MNLRPYASKVMTVATFLPVRKQLREEGRRLVFTNGCFDILHLGHVDYLQFARMQGDALVVGLNADSSVRKSKGTTRPIVPEQERARVLGALESVDFVIIFSEDEPASLIGEILPDVLVKGEDWAHYVSGRDIVERNGGRVVLAPLVPGRSTTDIIGRIRAATAEGSK